MRAPRKIHGSTSRRSVGADESGFDAIFDTSIEGMFLTSPDGRIHRANREACRILNMSEAEICGAGRAGIVDETDPRFAAAIEERRRTGKFKGELAFRRKGGELFPAEFSSAVFTDRLGESKTIIVFRDVTNQRRAEAERGYLAAIVESSADAIVGKLPDGTITSWNAAAERLYGYSQAEMLGRSIDLIVPEDRAIELSEALRQVAEGKQVRSMETQRLTKDHERVDIALTLSPIRNTAGDVVGISSIARDISSAKRAEAERERLIRELQAAVSDVKTLSGLLPICARCKKIRDDKGYWNQIEIYLRDHADVTFTHGICPECARELYGEAASGYDSQREHPHGGH